MSLLAAASASSAGAEEPKPPRPVPIEPGSWVSPDDYPVDQAQIEGVVGFRLDVDSTGAVTACSVTAPSGSDRLDSVTCDILRRRARFEPARDGQGAAIASSYRSRVRWTIPPVVRPGSEPTLQVTTLVLEPDGRISSCSIETRGPLPDKLRTHGCLVIKGHRPTSNFLREQAGTYRTVRLVSAMSPNGRSLAATNPAWGTLVLRSVEQVSYTNEGKPFRCATLATFGPPGPDVPTCEAIRSAIMYQGGYRGAPASTIRFEIAVYGIRR